PALLGEIGPGRSRRIEERDLGTRWIDGFAIELQVKIIELPTGKIDRALEEGCVDAQPLRGRNRRLPGDLARLLSAGDPARRLLYLAFRLLHLPGRLARRLLLGRLLRCILCDIAVVEKL